MNWPGNGTLLATCAGGAESFLTHELRSAGLEPLGHENGVVRFTGRMPEVVAANRRLRTASRVLVPLVSGSVSSYDEIYRLARSLDWSRLISPTQTIRVSAVTRSRNLTDSSFAAVRVKDAVTDSQRAKARDRSSVSKRDPDVGLSLFVSGSSATLSLDSSGRPLHERGYRRQAGEAPLRENLAATLLLAADWDRESTLFDPFCGSGTIVIEAALLAAGTEPGALGRRYAYENWVFTPTPRLEPSGSHGGPRRMPTIVASDHDEQAVEMARANARRAGVHQYIDFSVADVRALSQPAARGVVITNPPYGERMNTEAVTQLMADFGRCAKEALGGWTLFFLSVGRSGASSVGLRTNLVAELYNGGIQTNFYRADIYPPRHLPDDAVD